MAATTLIIIALIDAPYQAYKHNEQLKMTKKEVKDERKDTDGSPEVKQRIRENSVRFTQRECLKLLRKLTLSSPTPSTLQ